jgi:hypothetical protein
MKSRSLPARAFFKDRHIEHYQGQGGLNFVCPFCCMRAFMDETTTCWACTGCGTEGNLLTLLALPAYFGLKIKHGFNPDRQRRDIQTIFLKAIKDGEMNDQRLKSLYEKTMTLIDYYRHSSGSQ